MNIFNSIHYSSVQQSNYLWNIRWADVLRYRLKTGLRRRLLTWEKTDLLIHRLVGKTWRNGLKHYWPVLLLVRLYSAKIFLFIIYLYICYYTGNRRLSMFVWISTCSVGCLRTYFFLFPFWLARCVMLLSAAWYLEKLKNWAGQRLGAIWQRKISR